ncbi:hypothetical protein GGX14DRAFT_556676 [Mycena pura]|uniref:Essential protein Yae1 N-terminal domain-containing protein n=1 Tax=Mycena pura TaxID=153505 RepID=A0AAD6YQ32_9AGAR|nr:hypothetical protein GGX14DRAFT_556676 [Mycena pura]
MAIAALAMAQWRIVAPLPTALPRWNLGLRPPSAASVRFCPEAPPFRLRTATTSSDPPPNHHCRTAPFTDTCSRPIQRYNSPAALFDKNISLSPSDPKMGDTTDKYKIPVGLTDLFRHPLDAANDFKSAFDRAVAFSAILGDDRVSNLWQRALEIGFLAGHGVTETAPQREAFDDYSLGHDDGMKEGRTSGLRDGKKEGRQAGKAQGLKEGELIGFERGLSEGKRLGFVAGREFGQKQAAKLSKPLASEHILVDTGTDSLPTELLPASVATYTSAFAQTDAQCDTSPPVLSTDPPFIWADEPSDVHIPNSPRLPPRDFSALRSDSSSSAPFATLRYRAHRTQKSPRGTHRPATCAPATHRSASRPSTANTGSSLDWDRDPRLFDLSRALRSLGWDIVGGGMRRRHRFSAREG